MRETQSSASTSQESRGRSLRKASSGRDGGLVARMYKARGSNPQVYDILLPSCSPSCKLAGPILVEFRLTDDFRVRAAILNHSLGRPFPFPHLKGAGLCNLGPHLSARFEKMLREATLRTWRPLRQIYQGRCQGCSEARRPPRPAPRIQSSSASVTSQPWIQLTCGYALWSHGCRCKALAANAQMFYSIISFTYSSLALALFVSLLRSGVVRLARTAQDPHRLRRRGRPAPAPALARVAERPQTPSANRRPRAFVNARGLQTAS